MATTKSWIKAARLRTLPLALAGILMGCGLAFFYQTIDWIVCFSAIVTATLIQVFSNFANDYGDNQRGTDNNNRLGPVRTLQSGEITISEMRRGMLIIGLLSFVVGIFLVYQGTWHHRPAAFFVFIALGVLSLLAAYFYTAGKHSYGYVGLGDLSVFLFFGLLPVLGVFYLNAGTMDFGVLFPAVTMGLFSTGVLNLNNMRDITNDRESGKTTLPVLMGATGSLVYHFLLIILGWLAVVVFTLQKQQSLWQWLFVLSLPLFIRDLYRIACVRDARNFDPFLKSLSLSTLAFVVLFDLGLFLTV